MMIWRTEARYRCTGHKT